MRTRLLLLAAPLLLAQASAAQWALEPSKDNTIWNAVAGNLSNGAGQHLFAGRTNPNAVDPIRRAFLAFDVAGTVPAGTTITDVRLVVHLSMSIGGPQPLALHRVSSDWGEAGSKAIGTESGGALAQPGDVTWDHAFFPSSPWTNKGGDFSAAPSGSAVVDNRVTWHAFESTPQMVADVQSWLDDPSGDFGWVMIGDEAQDASVKRLDSRDHPVVAYRPLLLINCGPAPVAYCTAKPGLSCGTPAIRADGASSVSRTEGLVVSASPARAAKIGVLLYTSAGRANLPFPSGGHILCLATPPLRRGGPVDSGGTVGPNCDGVFALDMNQFASGNYAPGFPAHNPASFLNAIGTQVDCQWWGRDTVATGSFMSDALEYFVCP